MKTDFRLVALGVGLMSLVLCSGCGQQQANAEEVPINAPPPPALIASAQDAKPAETPAPAPPAEPPTAVPLESPKPTDAVPVAPAKADTNIADAVMPETLQVTPALAEVIKLIQAGVGEDVLMAYITNSAEVFSIGSNEILYLHDLGAPPAVITTLIQTDLVRKQMAGTAKPLPPGVALTTPATNIFNPKAAPATAQGGAPPATAAETVATAAPEPPTTTGEPPVVYAPAVPEQPVNITTFYTELAPYGSWVDVPGYGYCWRPTVAVWNSSWRPYGDGGRWLWTDHGWYWYSDYSWGWAPFHYGRWSCPPGVGWVWTPDTCWGPAWVSWRYTRNHCGWAPLPPAAHFVVGHGFYHNSLSVGVSFDFGLSDHHYVFVPTSRFCDRRPMHHRLTAHHSHSIFKESTVVNNYVSVNNTKIVNQGVGYDRVAGATRGNIRQVALKGTSEVRNTNTKREVLAADGSTLTVARPAMNNNTSVRPDSRTRGQRDNTETPGRTAGSGNVVSGSTPTTPAGTAPDRVRPGRNVGSSAGFAAGETAKVGNETPATTPANPGGGRFQRPNMVPTSRGSSRADSVIVSGAKDSTTTDARPPRGGRTPVTVVPPANPQSTVSAPTVATPSRPNGSDRQRPQATGRPVVSAPAPPANVNRPVAQRPEARPTYVQPSSPRGAVARAPEPTTPRYSPPQQPAYRPAPAAPAPAPTPRQSAPAPSRSESYRPSSPAPAQAPSYSPPARSSGGGGNSGQGSPARSSGGNDGGGRRASR